MGACQEGGMKRAAAGLTFSTVKASWVATETTFDLLYSGWIDGLNSSRAG
jgi:hypothetical protein